MATSGWSVANLGSFLKEKFLTEEMERLGISKQTKWFKSLPFKKKKTLAGTYGFEIEGIPNQTTTMRGFDEWDDTVEPGYNTGQRMQFPFKWFNDTARVSVKSMVQAFIVGDGDTLNTSVQELFISNGLHSEKSLFIPSTGRLASVVSAASATSIVVDDDRFLCSPEKIGVLNQTTGNPDNGTASVVISGWTRNTPTNGQVTLTLASPGLLNFAGVDTTYGIYWSGNYNRQGWGLPDMISQSNPDGGNFGGVDRSLSINENYRCKRVNAGNSIALGEHMADLFDQLAMQTDFDPESDQSDYVIMTSPPNKTDMTNVVNATKLADFSTKDFELWGRALAFRGIPIIAHRWMPQTKMWFIPRSYLWMVCPEGMDHMGSWMSYLLDEKSPFSRDPVWARVLSKAGFESLYLKVMQCCTPAPNRFGEIYNVARRIVNL